MSTGYFEFPTKEDWKRIYNASAFKKIFSVLDSFGAKEHTPDDFAKTIELNGWLYEIRQRISDTARSYCFMMFYYEKGIPDKRWYISPGTEGESVQYYPDFKEAHFHIKAWFDFFSDTLYYKLFSAWDLIGHVLNTNYELMLKIDKVYFGTAIAKLREKDTNLYDCLKNLTDSQTYKDARRIRSDITHNYLPSTAHMVVHRDNHVTTIGFKKYVPSEEIVANVREALELFTETLQSTLPCLKLKREITENS